VRAVPAISILGIALALAMLALPQDRTLARLEHDTVPEVPQPRVDARGPTGTVTHHAVPLFESPLSRSAAIALFVNDDLVRARQLADRAWRRDHRDAEALFVQMEAAAMEADQSTMVNAALHLCEIGSAARQDPRIQLAAARLLESAANTPEFRAAVPAVQALLASSSEDWPELNAALLRAAMDGTPGLDAGALARRSGILTEWRIVGPIGRHPLLDFDQLSISPNDDLARASYDNHAVENFEFPDGAIALPTYLSPRGIYYAATHFASLAAGAWTVRFEGAGPLEIYVDGKRALRQDASPSGARVHGSATIEVAAGPHRVMAKFAGGTAPLRIALSPAVPQGSTPLRAKLSLQELTYDLAATAYADGEFGTAIEQIAALPSASSSAALQFLLAESWTRQNPAAPEAMTAWNRVRSLAPKAWAADEALGERALADGHPVVAAALVRHVLEARPDDISALETLGGAIGADPSLAESADQTALIWSRRLAQHPSCETSNQAMQFYRSRQQFAQAAAAQQKLIGCAPESLALAQSLAAEERHGEAARALQQLLAAAPLNRPARLMLVRELQRAGDDPGAQRAAATWLRIAPNSGEYRRLAVAGGSGPSAEVKDFYAPYRRDAVNVIRTTAAQFTDAPIMLLNDHVAIARSDGSVSQYVHTATQFSRAEDVERFAGPNLPRGAQILQLRTIHADGSVTAIKLDSPNSGGPQPVLSTGDTVDEEFVVNYTGDGGMTEHPEVFQFVFGRFDAKVMSSRFIVLTPAGQDERGVVIASSDAPRLVSQVKDGMLSRKWERNATPMTKDGWLLPSQGLAIVRVVEQENGWTVPSDAERHRRIETIHRGPRFQES
jgi:tetratricopeptide (TPR) repeat protein